MKTTKTLLTVSLTGLMLLTAACAEKGVRPETGHEHAHAMGHGHMRSLEQAVEQARTPSDHNTVAARYEAEAERLLRMAQRHENMARIYEETDNPKLTGNAEHCRRIAKHLRTVAEEMKALAQSHRRMANP